MRQSAPCQIQKEFPAHFFSARSREKIQRSPGAKSIESEGKLASRRPHVKPPERRSEPFAAIRTTKKKKKPPGEHARVEVFGKIEKGEGRGSGGEAFMSLRA